MAVTIAAHVPPFPFVTQFCNSNLQKIFLHAEDHMQVQLAEGTEWTGMVPHSYSPHLFVFDHRHSDCRNNPCCTLSNPLAVVPRQSIRPRPARCCQKKRHDAAASKWLGKWQEQSLYTSWKAPYCFPRVSIRLFQSLCGRVTS